MEMIGERLRTLRNRAGKTQEELSELLRTTQQVYSKYETNKRELPLRHLITLAHYYDVSTDYLLGQVPYQKIPPTLSEPLLSNVTVGDFVCRITSFSSQSKLYLIKFAKFLTHEESMAKARLKDSGPPHH